MRQTSRAHAFGLVRYGEEARSTVRSTSKRGGATVASFKDLILAKDKLSERYLRVAPRRRRDVIEPILSAKAAQGIAGGNVHAVGVGRKVVKGVPTRTLCVRVYVVQKLAKSVILRKNLIPTRIAGLPTDVIESPP